MKCYKSKFQQQSKSMRFKSQTALFLTILFLMIVSTNQCHYICQTCNAQYYSNCLTCPEGQFLIKIPYTTQLKEGTCGDIQIQNTNVVGIIILILSILSCVIFLNEEMFYFVFLFQSLGLIFSVQALWLPALDYVLSSFTYMMIFTKISSPFKQIDSQLKNPSIIKSSYFFKSTKLSANFSVIGIVNISLFLLMILIPVFKAIRKRINQERVNCLPDWVLDKILLAVNTAFLLIIQQSTFSIYFSLTYGKADPPTYIIVIIYFSGLLFFIINQWINPFPFFRNKFAQLNSTLSKIFIPLFIAFPFDNHFIVYIFILLHYMIDAGLTNKNKSKSPVNRLLWYKFIGIIVICSLLANYIIQMTVVTKIGSIVAGAICMVSLIALFYSFCMEIVIQMKDKYCIKKDDSIKQRNIQQILQQTIGESNQNKSTFPHIPQMNFQTLQFQKIDEQVEKQVVLTTDELGLCSQNKMEQKSEDVKMEVKPFEQITIEVEQADQIKIKPKLQHRGGFNNNSNNLQTFDSIDQSLGHSSVIITNSPDKKVKRRKKKTVQE